MHEVRIYKGEDSYSINSKGECVGKVKNLKYVKTISREKLQEKYDKDLGYDPKKKMTTNERTEYCVICKKPFITVWPKAKFCADPQCKRTAALNNYYAKIKEKKDAKDIS